MSHRAAEVFDENVALQESGESETPGLHGILLSTRVGPIRTASPNATYERLKVHILDLDVHSILFDYDDDEAEKEAALRQLAFVPRAYPWGSHRLPLLPAATST